MPVNFRHKLAQLRVVRHQVDLRFGLLRRRVPGRSHTPEFSTVGQDARTVDFTSRHIRMTPLTAHHRCAVVFDRSTSNLPRNSPHLPHKTYVPLPALCLQPITLTCPMVHTACSAKRFGSPADCGQLSDAHAMCCAAEHERTCADGSFYRGTWWSAAAARHRARSWTHCRRCTRQPCPVPKARDNGACTANTRVRGAGSARRSRLTSEERWGRIVSATWYHIVVLLSACTAHLTVDDPESKVCVECKLDRLNGLSIGPR